MKTRHKLFLLVWMFPSLACVVSAASPQHPSSPPMLTLRPFLLATSSPLVATRTPVVPVPAQVNETDVEVVSTPGPTINIEGNIPKVVHDPKYSLVLTFPESFYLPEQGGALEVDVTAFDNAAQVNERGLDLCVQIWENRTYQAGRIENVALVPETCQPIRFEGSVSNISTAEKIFAFQPSGFSFVWLESAGDRYQLNSIEAVARLRQQGKDLSVERAVHRPVPVRVTQAQWENQQVNFQVRSYAGNGETYTLSVKVYQVETDPDEIGFNSLFLFVTCLLPDVCEDYSKAGEASQPITLVSNQTVALSVSYERVPVKEDGNTILGYEAQVLFEMIPIGRFKR